MSPAAQAVAAPTRTEIEAWTTSHLADAAIAWRTAAAASEDAFDRHRININSPGGTTWEGDAKDAALDRVTRDIAVVGAQNEALLSAADLAENAATDIEAAKSDVIAAITAAENDGFRVGEDLSVTDTRFYELHTAAARASAASEYSEDVRWTAERLAQADHLAGQRLLTKAAELEGIRFDGERSVSEPVIQAVDFRGVPFPEEPQSTSPDQPPGGWSNDPITRTAQKIAYGHSSAKHMAEFGPGMTRQGLAAEVERILRMNSTNPGSLVVGRTADGAPALYDPKTNTLVIRDPRAPDAGTVFRPTAGETYIDRKMPTRLPALPPSELADGPPMAPRVDSPRPHPSPPASQPSARGGFPTGGPLPDGMLPSVIEPKKAGDPDLPVIGDGIPDTPAM